MCGVGRGRLCAQGVRHVRPARGRPERRALIPAAHSQGMVYALADKAADIIKGAFVAWCTNYAALVADYLAEGQYSLRRRHAPIDRASRRTSWHPLPSPVATHGCPHNVILGEAARGFWRLQHRKSMESPAGWAEGATALRLRMATRTRSEPSLVGFRRGFPLHSGSWWGF